MIYDALENKHGLKHDPWKALVVPRPVGWVSTLDKDGNVNLAPYSFFNGVGDDPHYVMFASSGRKHSLANAEATGEFVCSFCTYDLKDQMNITSADVGTGVDELALAGLTPAPSRFVKPPRVAESPAALECRYHCTLSLPGKPGGRKAPYMVVIGLVVGVYIDDKIIADGKVDIAKTRPLARLGYMDYAVVTPENVFSLERPSAAEALGRKTT
ncbi:MAG: flavin reductase family protein [Hyphomicrobiaceae bacterium]|nr:flavin reductase family protein [Hyphomicrobiaceae bacterium]